MEIAICEMREIALRDGKRSLAGINTMQSAHARSNQLRPAARSTSQVKSHRCTIELVPGKEAEVGLEQSEPLVLLEAGLVVPGPFLAETRNSAFVVVAGVQQRPFLGMAA